MKRLDFLKGMSGILINAGLRNKSNKYKSQDVVIIGGGLSGLSCGFELSKLGHNIKVLEASNHLGGHILTIRKPFDDGLYADAGAEHIVKSKSGLAYKVLWDYIKELDLDVIYYPHRDNILRKYKGKWVASEEWTAPKNLAQRGYNKKEIDYAVKNSFPQLPFLYFRPYLKKFKSQYNPLNIGLNDLDDITLADFFRKEGASSKMVTRYSSSNYSALVAIWHAAIMQTRGVPYKSRNLWRIQGGNEKIVQALGKRLKNRVYTDSEVVSIQHNSKRVVIRYKQNGHIKKIAADHIVCSLPFPKLKQIRIEPKLTANKQRIIKNITYYTQARALIQCGSRFWEKDGIHSEMVFGERHLSVAWPMAREVDTKKGILVGDVSGNATKGEVRSVLTNSYPGETTPDIEKIYIKRWYRDKWAPYCERTGFPLGKLSDYWPEVMRPEGRIHFASAGTDNLNWGMEAATNSARRVANNIHKYN